MWVTWLAAVLSFWVVLAILQTFTGNGRCSQWLELSGFKLGLFHLQWETTRFNRIFYRLGHGFPTMLDTWFGAGLACSLCSMIWSVYLLSTALVHSIQILTASTSPPSTGQVLQLVVPGVNLPLEQLLFFLPALLLSAVIHEIGHAVAATRDGVGLNSCGIFLFVLYPGAFVNLYTTQLHHLSPMRQLRIYCAGVWHNMVLAIVALALLLLLPWLMLPGYQMGSGVVVTSVTKGSAMSGPLGLEVGDLVSKLSTCKIASNEDWTQCLTSSTQNVHGMCMSEELVRSLQTTATVYSRTGDIECCDNRSLSDLCFSYSHEEMTNQGNRYACLPVRKALEMSGEHPCHTNADCPALLGRSIVFKQPWCNLPPAYLVPTTYEACAFCW
uniref:membrane-bound transcription factor site-2 protease-like n=1 Tax=Myxine glutinosa TaxID=7769 RepID=UPI00358DFB27